MGEIGYMSMFSKLLALILISIMTISCFPMLQTNAKINDSNLLTNAINAYGNVKDSILLNNILAVINGDASLLSKHENNNNVISISGKGSIIYNFTLPESTEYQLRFTYYLPVTNNRKVELGVSLNGDETFSRNLLTLPRVFQDETTDSNDKKPSQLPVKKYISAELRIDDYRRGEYLFFKFVKGRNVLKLDFSEQNIFISRLELIKQKVPEPYIEPINIGNEKNSIVIEGEQAQYKSDSVLAPTYDLTSPQTTPYRYDKVLLNTIGASSWRVPGQWIEWEYPVNYSGYYKISLRVRKDAARDMISYRRIYLDGVVPFAEFEEYEFHYNRSWYVETLHNRNKKDIYVFLEKGTHTIRLEAVMGNALDSNKVISESVLRLNEIYRQIIMITSASPDNNRSYSIFSKLPTIKSNLIEIAQNLQKELDRIKKLTNSNGAEISFLHQMAIHLEKLSKDENLVVTALSTLKSNISTLAALITQLNLQPLEIDQIVLSNHFGEQPKAQADLLVSIITSFKRFFASFVIDYSSMDSGNKDTKREITVWVMFGRDQAQIIRDMTGDTFIPEKGINVNLSLVSAGLNEAVMSGKGPDVALGINRTNVINLGVRGALIDLARFDSFETIAKRFQESSFNGYTFENKVYAMPNTQSYNIMFIRSDIYKELGLKVCNTWDELLNQISIFSQYHMQVGLPQSLINTILLQNGLTYYDKSMQKTVFSTIEAYNAYKTFTKMFIDYETPIYYDAPNRFRTGEMPVVIAPFSFYNTMSVLAPELKGLWNIYPLPGTIEKNGDINRTTDASGDASAIINGSKNPDDAFAFLDWWTDSKTQSRFASEIENILGTSGRYDTANIEAFNTLNWSADQRSIIQAQRKYIYELPETPASYIVSRNLNNLFIDVVANHANLRESLLRYSRQMDAEMSRKYKEIRSYYD